MIIQITKLESSNVNEIIVSEFIDAESKGKYINEIKKDYEFEKVEVEPIGTSGQPSQFIWTHGK